MEIKDDGEWVTIKFKKGEDLGPSRSGKTRVVASTFGNVKLGQDLYIGMTAFRVDEDEDTNVPARDLEDMVDSSQVVQLSSASQLRPVSEKAAVRAVKPSQSVRRGKQAKARSRSG